MWARLLSLLLLARGVIVTLLRRLSSKEKPLLAFAQRYGSEGIAAVQLDEAQLLSRVNGCVACGLCDRDEGRRIAQSKKGYRGMTAFALGGVRSLVDYRLTAASIEEVPREAFVQAERLCPTGVPLAEFSDLVKLHGARTGANVE